MAARCGATCIAREPPPAIDLAGVPARIPGAFQPTREGVGIVQRGLAKAEGVADLCPVIRGGPAAPVIAAPSFYRHLDLAGDRLDRRDGNLLKPVRKPTIGLEHLEQNGEAQPRGAGLVAEQRAVRRMQYPAVVNILAIPFGPHGTPRPPWRWLARSSGR